MSEKEKAEKEKAEKAESPKEKFNSLLKELRSVKSLSSLENMYEFLKENKSLLLENTDIPLQFSDDLVWCLNYNKIKVDTQLDILKLFIDEFFKMKCKPEDIIKCRFIFDIFKYDSNFYRLSSTDNFLIFLNRFFNIYYPKDNNIKHEVGDVMDVLINDELYQISVIGWIQLPIKRIDPEKNLYIFEDYKDCNKEVMISMDSFKVQNKNTFVKEEEMVWRNNLKVGDKVDYLTSNQNWVEGYVKDININGEISIKALGELDQNIVFLKKYSPFIQPLLKYSHKYSPDEENAITLLEKNNFFTKFQFFIPTTENNYLVPIDGINFYSLEYMELLNHFIKKMIESKILENESTPIEYLYIILSIIYSNYKVVHKRFIGKYFIENVYENMKQILMNYSLDKKKNKSKNVLKNLTIYTDILLGYTRYYFQVVKFLYPFLITYGYNCFKNSEILEKRLLGLSTISDLLQVLNNYFFFFGNETQSEITSLINDKLLSNTAENDLLGLLFNTPNIHEQLILKGVEVIISLSKLNILDDKDIDRLYNLAISAPPDSDINKSLYDLLNKIAAYLSLTQEKVIYNKIIEFPFDKLTQNDINLMKNILQNVKTKEDFKEMAKTFLDYYYNYMVYFKKKDTKLGDDFGNIMSYAKDEENLNYLYLHYFEKIVNEINEQNDLEGYRYYFTLIFSIFSSLRNMNDKDFSFLKSKFKEIFFKNNNYNIIVDKLLDLNRKEEKEINEEYINDVLNIVNGLVDFLDEKNFYTIESMMKLSDYFIFGDVLRQKRSDFMNKFLFIKKDEIDIDTLFQSLFAKFDKFLDTITPEKPERYNLLDESFISNVYSLYKDANKSPELVECKTARDFYNNSVIKLREKVNPLKTKYFDIVWKMFLKTNNTKKVNQFLEVFSLKNFTPSERHEIWEELIKKIFTDINSNNYICLKMIENILKISEKYGSGGCTSHLAESKKKSWVNIQINNDLNKLMPPIYKEGDKKLNSTSTLYDIKKAIQKNSGIDPIFIDFSSNNGKEALTDSNTMPLFMVFPKLIEFSKEKCNLTMKKSKDLSFMHKYPLTTEDDSDELTEKFLEVIREIYDRHTKGGKLDINNFKEYFNHAMNYDLKDTALEKKACESFHKYDSGNKGYWSIDDFIMFHANACKKNKDSLYVNLMNMGYTKSLENYLLPIKKESELYYEENNVKEYMPRYFIGNNKEYMGKLFFYAKNDDKSISELAQNLLKNVSTLEEMKKTLFENNQKIDEILSNSNLELRAYAYDILLSEFEKGHNKKNIENQNRTNNFINNNLYKLILELDKFNQNETIDGDKTENKENKIKEFQTSQFFNYYLSNLKIFFYAFKNIVNNPDLIDTIDKFEDLDDDNDKNKKKEIKITLDEDKMNLIKKLNLLKLVNIIGNNFSLFEKKAQQMQRQGIRLSIKILMYIILVSREFPDEEKIKIYKDFLNHIISLSQSSSSYFIKRNVFIMNKLLLQYMNEESDKKFVSLENEKIIKEVLDYKKLNNLSGKLLFFFRLSNDLYDLSIQDSQNDETFTFFENLLKIILDKNINLNEYLLNGYLGVIKRLLTTLKDSKYQKLYEFDFEDIIQKLINDFLITFEKDEKGNIIVVENQLKYSKYSEYEYVSNIYQILNIIISLNPEKNLKSFLENEEIKNVREKHLSKLDDDKNGYSPKNESRSNAGFVGLKNLSCLCYINSVIQQFFMIPLFKNAILSLPLSPDLKEEEDNDNLMFQLEKMFYYLTNSEKEHYNPKSFVYSFKDYDGNPTNINVQCDAQEFLSRLIEKIDEGLKGGSQKYLCNNIFGGTTLQQVRCTNQDCGNISERKENINYLSLDIKNCDNIQKCLDKFIAEEKIEDYHCEKCDKKITNIKNVLIDKIPNILIIHLQRIAFSYETFNMEKINDYIYFEKTLNIKNYTLNKNKDDMPSDYFEYELQGVLIHSGTAQFGHYYSIIYSEEKDITGKWYKFNDTSVTEINYDMMTNDAFGNNARQEYGSSAYMLIYQKKEKKPVIVDCQAINENIKKLLEENKDKDKIELPEGKIYYVYENEKEAIEKNINYKKEENKENVICKDIIIKNGEVEAKLMNYEEALDSLLKINNDENIKKPFVNTILLENIKLCNDKKFFTKGFTKFMYQISDYIKTDILEDKTNTKINTYIPILKTINDYILNILAKSNFKEELNLIVNNITDVYNHSVPKELISYLIKDVIEPIKEKLYINYFVSRDRIMGNDIATYVAKIICCGLNNNIEIEVSMKIVQFYVDKIPVEITRKWIDMESFNNLIMEFIQNSDVIKKTFIQNSMITKLIDFILGRSSPLYQGDDRIENKNNKAKFGPIVKAIALLYKYYVENHDKEEVKLSPSDLKLINHIQFYEKIVLDDYDNNATNLLIDNKIELSLILNKKENNDDFDKEILDILINLKVPSIKKREEIISGLQLITNLFKKYSEIYLNNQTDENKDKNEETFFQKLNILLGLPIPSVSSGEAEIKYICGKYQDKYTILSDISKEKETNKNIIPLLQSIFNLLDINNKIFEYMDKLPAPNSLKYSFLDYLLKLFILTEKQTEAEFSVNDEMGIKNPLKELSDLINDICKKNNKDLTLIKENEKIKINGSLYFNEFSFEAQEFKTINKLTVIEMTINYATMDALKETTLECFKKRNYFYTLLSRKGDNNDLIKDGFELQTLRCILICCESDMDLSIDFKPYFSSKMEIKGKKECHYFLYCMDYNKEEKIDYTKLNIEVIENQPLALPPGGEQYGNTAAADDGCSINCPVCGTVNVLNESNTEFKCVFCESPLF